MKKKYTYVIFVLILLILHSCARVIVPKGGEKDITPPKVSKSIPAENSTNFNAKEIRIDFDEYITLEDATGKLIVSPPLKNKPSVTSKLKSLYIKDLDSLEENTTYIFDFGDAIRDFNEGNPITNFVFSFSTGAEIDTMVYYGRLLNSYTHVTEKDKYIALYSCADKKLQTSQIPNYITRSDSLGRFFFKNIKEGTYYLLAYEDNNNNLIYDLSLEGVGFASLPIEAKMPNDSIFKGDTIYFTTAKDTVLKLSEAKFISEKEIRLSFSLPDIDSLQIDFVKPQITNFLLQKKITDTTSELNIFIIDEKPTDSVDFIVKQKDFLEKQELVYNKQKNNNKKTFIFSILNNNLSYYDTLCLEMPFPIDEKALPLTAKLTDKEDTLNINFYSDKNNVKRLLSDYVSKENTTYSLVIDSNMIDNLRGEANERLSVEFSTDSKEDYSTFSILIEDTVLRGKQIIYSLLDDKNTCIKTKITNSDKDSILVFDRLKEGAYKLRAIIDENNNGKWDGNNFFLHKQAEKILFFPKPINVRKSWDLEEIW